MACLSLWAKKCGGSEFKPSNHNAKAGFCRPRQLARTFAERRMAQAGFIPAAHLKCPEDTKKKDTLFSVSFFLERVTRLELASDHPENGKAILREPSRPRIKKCGGSEFKPSNHNAKAGFCRPRQLARTFAERRMAQAGFIPAAHLKCPEDTKKKDTLFSVSFFLERVTRLELATSTLARWRSTR